MNIYESIFTIKADILCYFNIAQMRFEMNEIEALKNKLQVEEYPHPLVSFIIPYYNESIDLLRECLESIIKLSLTDEEREIILVDDGSEASPLDGIMDFREKIVYVRQRNQGVSVARNVGLTMATGDFIQFVDADDQLIVAGYEHCLEIVRSQNPDMVVFNMTEEEGDVDTPYLFDGPSTGSEYLLHNNMSASVWSYMFSRSILGGLRFTRGVAYGEDEKFTPQLILKCERLFTADTYAYFYRQNPQSVTHQHSSEAIFKRLDDTEHVLFHLHRLSDTLPARDRLALQRRIAQLSMDYIYNIMTLSHSYEELEKRIERLESQGLFPLPDRKYTRKYHLFRRFTLTPARRKFLLRTLPLLKAFS